MRASVKVIIPSILLGLLLAGTAALAAELEGGTVSSGGKVDMQGSGYNLHDLKGQPAVGEATNAAGTKVEVGGLFGILGKVIAVSSPVAGANLVCGTNPNITWASYGAIDNVKIEYTADGGTWTTVVASTPNTGSFPWTVPTYAVPGITGNIARIRVSDVTDADIKGESGGFNITPVPTNCVPLGITRIGDNIQLNWNAAAGTPDIYVLSGDGNGQFSNTFNAAADLIDNNLANWEKVVDSGAVKPAFTASFTLNPAAQTLSHLNQNGKTIAQGSILEVYYKGLIAGTDPNATDPIPPNKKYLVQAWAVGKIDQEFYGGWNLIAAPFAEGTANSILGTNYNDNEQLWIWSNAENKFISTATFTGGQWPVDQTLTPAKGYWLDLSGVSIGTLKRTTIIGNVATTPIFTNQLYAGWDLIGNPRPNQHGTHNGFTATLSVQNDQIWIWDNAQQKFIDQKTFDGTNWAPNAQLLPGVGYWYNHIGSGFSWQLTE